ncbi:MAG: hypothetical protein K2Q13_04030 [Nitrosomonas sp.]|uniref:hypothetical protein n=1 Tax=Nitrosomonas sp. TaxID=42353 RepID=UPI0025FA0226|nr:hypothetical protein [Nitrosomonas sp.]MBY0474216.1 hypothetical protein [Nitrosomonas sp.]
MTIGATINTALTAVLVNSWAVELPPEPTFPAITFEIDSTPESDWVIGGGYTQHVITVTTFAYTKTELATYKASIQAAMEIIDGFITEEESGDAAFEDLPGVYAYFQDFRIRTAT